jgi:uncharacterized protein (TIGR02186 family)
MRVRAGILLAALLALSPPASAEDLAAGISRDTVEITSSFTGTDVVVFGAIEGESGEVVTVNEPRDVVVVIRSGNPTTLTVRQKERVGPIWANRDMRVFSGVPAFYFVATTRPLKEITSAETLDQLEVGLNHLALGPAPGSIGGPRAYREAIVRAKVRARLYGEHQGGVSFLSGTLFRTTVALPANVPAGNLKVLVYVFSRGQVSSSNSMTLFIDKTGVERRLSDFASNEPILYGLAAVFLSALAGFLASVALRERH